MNEWKLRDTILVFFMVIVVGVMMMQMVQNDRLYTQVVRLINTIESGTTSFGSNDGTGTSKDVEWLVPDAEPGGTLTFCYTAQPSSLNPLTYKDWYAAQIISECGLYMTLLDRDPDTLKLTGLLAKSWSVSEDKLQIEYTIKEEAIWSDGKPVTAHDVEFSFRAMMIPQVDAQRTQTYYIDVDNVEALDDNRVRFNMKKRYFKSIEMSGGMSILPQHVIDPDGLIDSDPKELAKIINKWNAFWKDETPVGCGPYLLESWDKTANRIVVKRNDRYWGPVPPLNRIVFRFITNDVARMQSLKAEELDGMFLAPEQWQNETNDQSFLDRFEKLKWLKVSASYNYIGYNQRQKPFDERNVRYAIGLCVPRELIREKIFYNLRELANSPFGINSPQSSPNVGQFPYDPERAKQLLAESGFKDTDGDGVLDRDGKPLEFSLSIPAGSVDYENVCALIQDELAKIGVRMAIDPYEWSVFEERLSQRDFEVCMLGWGGVIESDAYQVWHSSSAQGRGSNHIGFANAEVDKLIEDARIEFDVEKRNEMYHRIHEIIFEEQPYTFLFYVPTLMAHHKRVKNVRTTPIGTVMTEWWIPRDQRRTAE